MTFEEVNDMPYGKEQIEAFNCSKANLICQDFIHQGSCRFFDDTITKCNFYQN